MKDYSAMSDCIIYQGYKHKDGYGRRTFKGKVRNAHRVAYCEAHGMDIDDIAGRVILHKCDNPPCINPDHLELGTQHDNISDMVAKGRVGRNYGNRNQAKLSESEVQEIRIRYVPRCSLNGGESLAKHYGVTPSAISLIVNHKNWGGV